MSLSSSNLALYKEGNERVWVLIEVCLESSLLDICLRVVKVGIKSLAKRKPLNNSIAFNNRLKFSALFAQCRKKE